MTMRIYKLISTALMLLFTAVSANAFDFANREIIGFSPDGKYFAFEQYGSQDGSGFSYSDIFIINTLTDKWVKGSPYRYLLKDDVEEISLLEGIAKARKINRKAASDTLAGITDPGIIAASRRADQIAGSAHELIIAPKSFILPDNIDVMYFRLEDIALEPSPKCLSFDLGNEFFGFRLYRTGVNGEKVVMHEDSAIPKSRSCPLGYEPSDVIIHISDEGKFTVAVLVRMAQIGFEGSDRRFIAVTGSLN